MFLQSHLQTIPPTQEKSYPKFRTTLENTPLCPPEYSIVLVGILIFWWVRSPCKISEPYDEPFWDFSNGEEKKSGRRKNTENSSLPELIRRSHSLLSDQNVMELKVTDQNISLLKNVYNFHFEMIPTYKSSKMCNPFSLKLTCNMAIQYDTNLRS
jgi:hypothetical protein